MPIKLNKISTQASKNWNKEDIKAKTAKNHEKINALQNILHAQGKHSLLIVFQGVDASGKDGAIRSICSALNPLGFRVFGYKKPTEEEFNHDFLWRIHKNTPEKGYIHLFNRSHYEDILVPLAEGFLPKNLVDQRFELINQFEDLLAHNHTHVIKFYMHVSRDKQLERLKERIELQEKHFKHNDGDWETRKKWDQYQSIYQDILARCNKHLWHIIPSDQNWVKDYHISKHVLELLESLDLSWPKLESTMFLK
jgi:PPK2 family polyphosphate:nucleotide phosphotransferase